ncbi:hypothetical protein C8R45DRAFT_1188068 [Mycena sanguinolenta]|nr:hypothetical protein C8R45DRAFT_1188068 [Mycena sanguinolenta]
MCALLTWLRVWALHLTGSLVAFTFLVSLSGRLLIIWRCHGASTTPLRVGSPFKTLRCFGSTLHEGAPESGYCYPPALPPGCKGKLRYCFDAPTLARSWATVFALDPLDPLNVLVALLCANHVMETFGGCILASAVISSFSHQDDGDSIPLQRNITNRTNLYGAFYEQWKTGEPGDRIQ